jgi:hypothetical protein
MMVISALTTVLAIAAVVIVIGYRMFGGAGGGLGAPIDEVVALPKGARVLSMAGSSGRFAILIDVGGAAEMRIFDMKTLKQTGRLRFSPEP